MAVEEAMRIEREPSVGRAKPKEKIMRTPILAAICALAFTACGGSNKEESSSAQAGTTSGRGQTSGGETGMQSGMAAICPMEVEGTTVQAEVVDGGASLVFITTGDVDELRQRVRNMAAMQETTTLDRPAVGGIEPKQPSGRPSDPSAGAKAAGDPDPTSPGAMDEHATHGGGSSAGDPGTAAPGAMDEHATHGGGTSAGMGEEMMMPEIDTRVEDIEDGARLVIIAADPIDLDAVRANVEKQAMSMSAGQCPAMEPAAQQPTG